MKVLSVVLLLACVGLSLSGPPPVAKILPRCVYETVDFYGGDDEAGTFYKNFVEFIRSCENFLEIDYTPVNDDQFRASLKDKSVKKFLNSQIYVLTGLRTKLNEDNLEACLKEESVPQLLDEYYLRCLEQCKSFFGEECTLVLDTDLV